MPRKILFLALFVLALTGCVPQGAENNEADAEQENLKPSPGEYAHLPPALDTLFGYTAHHGRSSGLKFWNRAFIKHHKIKSITSKMRSQFQDGPSKDAVFQFDEEGRLVRYDANQYGGLFNGVDSAIYIYENGRLTQNINSPFYGLGCYTNVTYEYEGDVCKVSSYREDGSLYSVNRVKKDGNGRRWVQRSYLEGVMDLVDWYTYDAPIDPKMIVRKAVEGELVHRRGASISCYQVEKNRLVKKMKLDSKKLTKEETGEEWTYNENEDLIRYEQPRKTVRPEIVEFKYDSLRFLEEVEYRDVRTITFEYTHY